MFGKKNIYWSNLEHKRFAIFAHPQIPSAAEKKNQKKQTDWEKVKEMLRQSDVIYTELKY